MTRTGQQIENDVYNLLLGSQLASTINGHIYKSGTRPENSLTEDAEVSFVEGLNGQIQSGTVDVNIYVPDVEQPESSGAFFRNVARCEAIEAAAQQWFNSLVSSGTDYRFTLAQTISAFDIEDKPDINQHFISIKLNFQLLTI